MNLLFTNLSNKGYSPNRKDCYPVNILTSLDQRYEVDAKEVTREMIGKKEGRRR